MNSHLEQEYDYRTILRGCSLHAVINLHNMFTIKQLVGLKKGTKMKLELSLNVTYQ